MSFFGKLKSRMFKSSSRLEEGLDAIVEEGDDPDAPDAADAPDPDAPRARPRPRGGRARNARGARCPGRGRNRRRGCRHHVAPRPAGPAAGAR